ncbi:transcriptional repressor ILP1-like [Phoenix dactylifera]|uniref:Transcriptional repressor ILP1-like n=1 Tax=Phoenix dactylifera TaxID=42345 RepID=A0A8B8J8G7_PHODC|nr:transcriptional repressor ILP1-like [Phoenix dactylifera]XP_026663246.2 transcriptional repressor ILP1-like [Phoenix dactylifera]XP_026663247.2 transcriptional repressor ILP1-like [Phoenix dactylifera]XP_038979735.1 transcriptional repressor ILP1-like [Phoenix dactylifera]
MSSSRVKNFRRRSDDRDANGEEKTTTAPAASTATTSTSTTSRSQTLSLTKPKSSKPEGPKRLSFADDEEEEGVATAAPRQPSKPVPSIHKLSSAKERSKTSTLAPSIPSNVQPQTGEYTKERLFELQKNARPLGSMPRPKPAPSFSEPPKPQKTNPPPAEPVIILKGLVKPASTTTPGQEGEKGAASKRQEEEEEEEDGVDDGEEEEDEQRGHAEKGRKLLVIPDRATIDAIRAKRAHLQQPRHSAPDYISLDGGMMSGHPTAVGSSDEEENDFQGRVALFGGKMDGRPKRGVLEIKEERVAVAEAKVVDSGYRDVADDEDEEERKWEEEQFRKGLGRKIDEASTQRGVNSIPTIPPIQPQVSIYLGAALQSSMSNVSLGPASIVVSQSAEVMSIPQQAEVATRALQENISKLKETHNITLNSLVRTDTHLSEALSEITSLEKSLKSADEKYVFMQQLRDFISVMCDFLHDKAYFIEELEEQMQKLHEQRALAVVERRTFDIADEANELDAAVNAAISVLNKGTSPAHISVATTAAQAAAAAARESSSLSAELDEFGRDVNLKKRMEFTQRAEARKRRKVRSESKRMSSIGKDIALEQIEGEVSTDESDSESSAYESSRNELLRTAEQIFSDASEEYSNLKIVKERFERWKNQFSLTYRDAYVSLSAPAVFSPYVRLELLKWDPLYDTTDFFDMEWHKLLFNYGLPGKDRDFDPDDADANLIPELVEKVALPILHHEIAHCWDMFSTQMTKNVVFATNMAINYVPASSKALHELLAVVRSRLTEAITGLSLPAWGTVLTNAVPGAAQLMAYRFGMSVRLLRNICLWKNILALPVLEKLALEELLRGKLVPHVRSIMSNIHDAITRTERIVASLSGVWTGLEITIEPSQKLWPLVDCISELGNKLEKRHALGVSKEDTRGLARRLKNMLVALHEYDKARAMLRTFQLKEAL